MPRPVLNRVQAQLCDSGRVRTRLLRLPNLPVKTANNLWLLILVLPNRKTQHTPLTDCSFCFVKLQNLPGLPQNVIREEEYKYPKVMQQ